MAAVGLTRVDGPDPGRASYRALQPTLTGLMHTVYEFTIKGADVRSGMAGENG